MTTFKDLPPEVLREIIFQVLLLDQSVCREPEDGNRDGDVSPTVQSQPEANSASSLKKIFTGSFVQGREVVHDFDTDHMYSDSHWYFGCVNSRIKRNSLLALSLTCWELNAMVEPVLWEIVELHGELYSEENPVRDFLYSILKKPVRAKYPKGISLRRDRDFWDMVDTESGGPPWQLLVDQPAIFKKSTQDVATLIACDSRTEQDIQRFLDSYPASIQWGLIWFLLPNLRTANFPQTLPSFWERFIDMRYINALKLPPGLHNLEELSLSCFLTDGRCTPNFLLPLFLLPSLRILYFDHFATYDYAENWNLIPHPPSSYEGKSSILSLDFEMCVLLEDTLYILLKMPQALETFTWTWGRSFNKVTGEGAAIIGEALEVQAASLRKIHFRGSPDGRAEDYTIIGDLFSVGFPALEEIGIPISLLLFDRGKVYPLPRADTPVRTLAQVLPPTLVRLRLYVYDEWLMSNWTKELRGLFALRTTHVPQLAYVWVEYWISAEEDKEPIFPAEKEERARKMEMAKASFQELADEGDENGIRLEFFLCEVGRSLYR